MMPASDSPWAHLEPILEMLLRTNANGLSEFELIRALQAHPDCPDIDRDSLRDPMALFRTHFALFHSLYRLDRRLRARGDGETVIVDCFRCRLVFEAGASTSSLAGADPMAMFYLDRGNIDRMDAAEVARLMGGFWRAFRRRDDRADALAVLGLEDPVSDAEIKTAYRRLAMRHHPDRGGDKAALQRINDAAKRLGVRGARQWHGGMGG